MVPDKLVLVRKGMASDSVYVFKNTILKFALIVTLLRINVVFLTSFSFIEKHMAVT